MRELTTIVVHHSASNGGNASEINKWHLAKGYSGIGYHFVILRDGTVEKGRSITEIGAHCKGHNMDSVGICLIGKLNIQEMTGSQSASLRSLIQKLLLQHPSIHRIVGHRDLCATECPGFSVTEWWLNKE